MLEEEIAILRRRLQDAPAVARVIEESLVEARGRLSQAVTQNEKLSVALEEICDQLGGSSRGSRKAHGAAECVRRRARVNTDGHLDVITGGRKAAAPTSNRPSRVRNWSRARRSCSTRR